MGDIADFVNDSYCYWGEESEDAYDGGFWPKEKKQVKCNKCGSVDVYWDQYPSGKWFLFTDGKPHVCGIISVKPHIGVNRTLSNASAGIEPVYTREYTRRIPRPQRKQTIKEQYNNARICPYCGTRAGFAPGTGDCGCSVDPE